MPPWCRRSSVAGRPSARRPENHESGLGRQSSEISKSVVAFVAMLLEIELGLARPSIRPSSISMSSQRISSGTDEYPHPRDVYRALLSRLVNGWVHFEVIAERGGWFHNLLSGRECWVEVALLNQKLLELNPGIPKSKRNGMPEMPAKWRDESKGAWIVPLAESDELIDWIDRCLSSVSGRPNYRVTGWIED